MLSVFRCFLVSVVVVILTACGGGGSSGGNPATSNNETYIDNSGDIVPVLSEKPDVLDVNLDNYDELYIKVVRNINLNSELAKTELSKYSAPTENIVLYYTTTPSPKNQALFP